MLGTVLVIEHKLMNKINMNPALKELGSELIQSVWWCRLKHWTSNKSATWCVCLGKCWATRALLWCHELLGLWVMKILLREKL